MYQDFMQLPAWSELNKLNNRLQSLVADTLTADATTGHRDPWEATYEVVFSSEVSKRVYVALSDMGQRLDYYDPDSSYEDDVLAFASAVQSKISDLQSGLSHESDSFEP